MFVYLFIHFQQTEMNSRKTCAAIDRVEEKLQSIGLVLFPDHAGRESGTRPPTGGRDLVPGGN